jgi:hypothetical protein
METNMPRWLRVLRGMIGTGLTFALGVGVVATMIVVLPTWLLLGGDSGLDMLVMAIKSSIWALPIGIVASGILALTARDVPFHKLSLPRFAALGVGGGLLLFGALAANAWQAWSVSDALANLLVLTVLGGVSATATLMIARRAGPTLGSGDHASSIGEGEYAPDSLPTGQLDPPL